MLNHIDIQGRLTNEPDLRTTQNGDSVASFTIACDRDYDRSKADFVNCVAWRKTGEFISKYFHKGSLATISGRLQSRKWQDRDGNNRTAWEVICDNVYFGERKQQEPSVQFTEIDDDGDIPF